jgi:hypothetical protein
MKGRDKMTREKLNKPNSLFYLPTINKFADNEWDIVHSLNQIFRTWELDQWKRRGQDSTLLSRNGTVWHLYYLGASEENEILELIHWNMYHGIKMDRANY